MRTQVWIGGVILVLMAGGLRLVNLQHIEPWEDEVYTHIGSGNLIPDLLMWQGQRATLHSPLVYLEVKVARTLLGKSNLTLRLPAVFWGTAAVVLLYLAVGWRVGWVAGFFAGLFLAMDPFAVTYGRDARMYSGWLVAATVLLAYAPLLYSYARREGLDWSDWLNWRFWLLGMLMMWAHATVIFAVTTIFALAIWLGLMGVMELVRNRKAGVVLLAGSALSGIVYLFSWSLAGIARIMFRASRSSGADGGEGPGMAERFLGEMGHSLGQLAGHLPWWLAAALWIVALVGLGWAAWRGHWRFVLLLVLIGAASMMTFPMIASKGHFYAARYVIVAMLGLAAGIGCLTGWLWQCGDGGNRMAARAAVIALFLGLGAMWAPVLREVITMPRVEYEEPFAAIRKHSKPNEVITASPEWYTALNAWYEFKGKSRFMLPPVGSIYHAQVDAESLEAEGEAELPGGYDVAFEEAFRDGARPPATWLILVDPMMEDEKGQPRFHKIKPILEAYGQAGREELRKLAEAFGQARVVTLRVDSEGFSHITTGGGREVDYWQ